MEVQIVSLLSSRTLLTANEAAYLLHSSEVEVRAAFAAVANANAGDYALLRGTVEEAARGSASTITKVTMQKVTSTDSEDSAYALMALTYPAHATASAAPIALRPSTCDVLRAYPIVSRAVMESRPANTLSTAASATSELLPHLPSPSPSPAAPATVKVESLAAPPIVKNEAPRLPTPATLPPAQPVLTATEAQPVAVPAPRTPTIFDMMKEAAAAKKRPRETDEAPVKAKKAAAAAKSKKAAKTENTTSLAKLARASKKQAGAAAAPSSVAYARSFLDEDDGDAMNGSSNSEESTHDDALAGVAVETPVLDVVEVSASNDDVILCDDAAPLAFRPAEPVASATATAGKREMAAAKSNSTAEPGAAQCTLGSFFNPAVVDFQKSYVREVRTEMKVENGEYICIDVPCFKHKVTGDVISEEEYHKKTAQLVRSRDATTTETPTHKAAGAVAVTPPSPAAKSASQNPNGKAEKTKSSPTPAKTLMSFFKPAAARKD